MSRRNLLKIAATPALAAVPTVANDTPAARRFKAALAEYHDRKRKFRAAIDALDSAYPDEPRLGTDPRHDELNREYDLRSERLHDAFAALRSVILDLAPPIPPPDDIAEPDRLVGVRCDGRFCGVVEPGWVDHSGDITEKVVIFDDSHVAEV
jgi:hypothetical protein